MKLLMTTAHATLLDGVNRHIQVLAPALAKMPDVELLVATCLPRGELHEVLEKGGVKTCSLGVRSIRSLGMVVRFFRLLLKFKPDVVHVELPVMAEYFAVHFMRIFGVRARLVETIHGIGGSAKVSGLAAQSRRTRLYAWFRARHDGIIFISKGVADARKGMNKFETAIYNPMDFGEWRISRRCVHGLRTQIGVGADVPIVGTACRITEVKRPDCFVRVMIEVLRRHPTAHGVVMGDGDKTLMQTMRQLITDSGLESRLHLLGYRSDAKQLIGAIDCFIMTSYREGMPTALLEAISQKVPVAFWKGEGGLKDLAELGESGARGAHALPESTNTTVNLNLQPQPPLNLQPQPSPLAIVREQDDIVGLAEGIVDVLNDPVKRRYMAERAFDIGKRTFDLDAIAAQTVKFYNEVLSK